MVLSWQWTMLELGLVPTYVLKGWYCFTSFVVKWLMIIKSESSVNHSKNINRNQFYKTFPRKSVEFIKWFDSIENMSQCKFIHLGIAEFSPSISEEILDNEILFAQQYIDIPEKDLRIIKHCRKSLSYNDNKSWKKKKQNAASTSPWAVFMVPKCASSLASIYFLYCQINLINNLLVCIGMINWYFWEIHLNRKQTE